ncbi:MAG: tetratricopeptide repeat protein [Proteobacteria bacterium]|nr:tetratricopeptide repeat protein [Pseudomonadota bacterium]
MSHNHLLWWQALCYGSVLVATFSCVHISADQHSADASGRQQTVLYQVGADYPEYSNYSQLEWQQIASRGQLSVAKIYALLVVQGSEEALTEARRYLAKYPGNLTGFEALAHVLYAEKKLALANHYARYVLARDPERKSMYNVLGLIAVYEAESLADYREAEALFSRAVESESVAHVALLNLGFLHLEMGALARAKASFFRAKDVCDSCPISMLGLGITLRRLDEFQEAEKYLRLALKSTMPDRTRYKFYFHLALVLRNNPQRIQEALKLLAAVINQMDAKEELYIRSQAVLDEIRLNIPKTLNSSL